MNMLEEISRSRVRGLTRSVSARRWGGKSQLKTLKVKPTDAMPDA